MLKKKTFIFVWKIKVLDQSMLSLISTFELTNLKYDKFMIQVNIFFVQKIPFQVSVMVFVSSMLFPDTGGGVSPCQAVCCFPTQGLKYCGALHHFRSDDTYARWEIGRLGSNLFWLNKKKRKVWLVIYPNRANDTKLNKFVGLTTHLSRANDNRK